MSWGTELYVVKIDLKGRSYDKSLTLEEIKEHLRIEPYGKSYDDYVKPGLLYFTQDTNVLARELNILKINPKGLYIMGIYGGEKKRGKEKYAGLVLEDYFVDKVVFKFRLYNTSNILVVPQDLLKKYGIKVHSMIYRGEINPFKLKRCLNIILSQLGKNELKSFLKEALNLNSREVSKDTAENISGLINELRQPSKITPLNANKFYIIYRCNRAFTAFAFKPNENNVIIESHVGYAECESDDIAYYYVATLNYLAYKVLEFKRTFIRDQFARPLLAIYVAGLSWKGVDKKTRERVIELSRKLHEKASDKDYSNQEAALRDIAQCCEFKELVSLLDSEIDRERLEEALGLVSGVGESSQQGLNESLES
jgi:hypothetical protein